MSNELETAAPSESELPDRIAGGEGQLTSDIPRVPSPYQGIKIPVALHLRISAYWFATNFVWGAMLEIMLPAESTHLAPHFKAVAILLLTSLSAVVALFVPLLAGALSDRCAHRMGRRRPFIIAGVVMNVVGFLLMSLVYSSVHPLSGAEVAKMSTLQAFQVLLSNG